MEYLPYTYLIGWSSLNKWYYGVEYGIKKIPCANPKNLWITYFTSSNLVDYFRKIYGEPDVIQVRKIFLSGSLESRMEEAITWEKRVLSKINISDDMWLNGRIGGNICPTTNKKTAMLRYGVENVFQSIEIKEKIKDSMIRKYGVSHPSYSAELLEKKKQNNIKKYGVSSHFNLPDIRNKSTQTLRQQSTKDKRQQTILDVYGVAYISQNQEVKCRVATTRRVLSNRNIVKLMREYKRVFNITLTPGWYQLANDRLIDMLNDMQQQHGTFTIEALLSTKVIKKYSNSIKQLQERSIVKEIRKYKTKFGRKIQLGRSWDRKHELYLTQILQDLKKEYGIID
jgi:hypothetical protein